MPDYCIATYATKAAAEHAAAFLSPPCIVLVSWSDFVGRWTVKVFKADARGAYVRLQRAGLLEVSANV